MLEFLVVQFVSESGKFSHKAIMLKHPSDDWISKGHECARGNAATISLISVDLTLYWEMGA